MRPTLLGYANKGEIMTIDKKMTDALNVQIREEFYSAYLYFAMAADYESKDWPGVAGWMKTQAQEEIGHAVKLYNWINERGGKAVFESIDKPRESWDSALELFEEAFKHEQHITACFYDLVKTAREVGDIATEIFLQWFVTEQVEEEENVGNVLEQLKLLGNAKGGLFMMDRELAKRQTPGMSTEIA
jgi:ferritin